MRPDKYNKLRQTEDAIKSVELEKIQKNQKIQKIQKIPIFPNLFLSTQEKLRIKYHVSIRSMSDNQKIISINQVHSQIKLT